MSNQTSKQTLRRTVGLAAGIAAGTWWAGTNSAHAQAAAPAVPPPPPPPPRWESSISAGLTLTRGNSDTFLAVIAAETKKKWEQDDVAINGAFGYGESKTDGENHKTDHYAKAAGQWNHNFTERFYAGVRLDGLYDEIAGVEYRFTLSPLAGYYLVKNPETFFRVEAGPAFILERQRGEDTKGYIGARLSERLEHKISATAKIWEQVDFIPQVDKVENYLVIAEAGIETAISKAMALRLVAQDNYDHQPAPGREKNDFKLIASLAYKF
jgi:putative salt-induced outer membrane protein YdiY